MGQRTRRRHRTGTYSRRDRVADSETVLLESHIRRHSGWRCALSLSRHRTQVLENWVVRFLFRRQIPIPSPDRTLARINRIPLLRSAGQNDRRGNRLGSMAFKRRPSHQIWAQTLLPSQERSSQLPISEPLETSNELRYCRPCSRGVLKPESIRELSQNPR